MSRWGEMFAALSHQPDTVDTVDTVRRQPVIPLTVSHSVHCVTRAEREIEATAPDDAQQPAVVDCDEPDERAAIIEYGAGVPRRLGRRLCSALDDAGADRVLTGTLAADCRIFSLIVDTPDTGRAPGVLGSEPCSDWLPPTPAMPARASSSNTSTGGPVMPTIACHMANRAPRPRHRNAPPPSWSRLNPIVR
jgi:hypothetical protein